MSNPTAARWDALAIREMHIDSGSANLFRNGRQQVRLLLKLQAAYHDDPVKLSDEEIDSITLVNARTKAPLTRLEPGDVATTWGWTDEWNSNYDFYPAALRAGLASEEAGEVVPRLERNSATEQHIHWHELFVQTTASTPLEIAFRITRDDDVMIHSNDDDALESSVRLLPLPIPTYSLPEYEFKKIEIEGSADNPFLHDGLDYYRVGLFRQGAQIQFREFTVEPAGLYRWDAMPSHRGSFTGYADAGKADIRYFRTPPPASAPIQLLTAHVRPGYGVVVMVRRTTVPRQSGTSEGPASISLIDQFGNEARRNVRFVGFGRHHLELT